MNGNKDTTSNRLIFLDNLRSLMVLLVLVFHSGASYGTMVAFWPFHEADPSELLDHLMPLFDVFMMSILFFIAGYFALPSLEKEGGNRFLKSKLKRLGVPWLVGIVLVLPVLDYVHYFTQSTSEGLLPRSFGTHWWLSMKKIGELHVGPMEMSGFLDMTQHFYQRYMWFLSLLLLLFVVFWLLYEARKKWGPASGPFAKAGATSNRSPYPALAVTGLLSVLLFALAKSLTSSLDNPLDMVWFSLGNVTQFQLAKLAFYVPYFGLGVYAYSRGWFKGGKDVGKPWAWGLICLLLTLGSMLVGRNLTRATEPSLGLQLAFAVIYPLWTFSFLGVFTACAFRHWNRATPLNRRLAANSYNMYLVHYVFALTLPLLLSVWAGGTTLVKFGIVAQLTILLSYLVSHYVIRPYPRLVVIGLGGLSVLLAVFV
ncbi:MAG TPA: acyltransferase family protein [Anaerolineae bacterium]|nr:acyltransferase family protein [Anaerolineae bacterium]